MADKRCAEAIWLLIGLGIALYSGLGVWGWALTLVAAALLF